MLGGCCTRSAPALGGALGSFVAWTRSRLAATSFSAPTTACTATTSPSSSGPWGQLDAVATWSRTLPRPAAPPVVQVPRAGPSRTRTSRPGCPVSTHDATRPTSTTEAAPCTAMVADAAARHPTGRRPRSQRLRLSAQLLNGATCGPARAWASSQGQEGGRSIG
jgi:hypothetical protein